MVWTKTLMHTVFACVLAGGILLLGSATSARAESFDSCRRNVDKWEDHLERDINRHGVYSRQANHDRHELDEARESCERQFANRWRDNDGNRR
jgi:hypothetical protein